MIGITHAVNEKSALVKPRGWTKEELVNLGGALVVAPVADPDYILLLFSRVERAKDGNVRRLVQRPDATNAKHVAVNAAQRLSEREHAIKLMDTKGADLIGRGGSAMMRVMEQKTEAEFSAKLELDGCQCGRIPLVQDHHVDVL